MEIYPKHEQKIPSLHIVALTYENILISGYSLSLTINMHLAFSLADSYAMSLLPRPSYSYNPGERMMEKKLYLPIGFRFLPTDVELLGYYLKNKNLGYRIPPGLIHDCNIYKYTPEQLAGMYGVGDNNEMYFFTGRERKTSNATRPDRTAGDGYWKSNRTHTVVDSEGRIWGYKMNLKFYRGRSPSDVPTDWLMDEYRIGKIDQPHKANKSSKMNGFVLCRIHKHKSQARKSSGSLRKELTQMPIDETIEEERIPPGGLSEPNAMTPTYANGALIDMSMAPPYYAVDELAATPLPSTYVAENLASMSTPTSTLAPPSYDQSTALSSYVLLETVHMEMTPTLYPSQTLTTMPTPSSDLVESLMDEPMSSADGANESIVKPILPSTFYPLQTLTNMSTPASDFLGSLMDIPMSSSDVANEPPGVPILPSHSSNDEWSDWLEVNKEDNFAEELCELLNFD